MKMLKDNKQLKGMLLAAGIAMISLLVVFAANGFFPLGRGSIVAIDLNAQYTPLLYRFYDVVSGIKNLSIDFHIGGGINLYSDTLTEIVNPFDYILFFFGRANIYRGVNILLLLYVMAASATAYYALNVLAPKTGSHIRLALAISYSMSYFCAYQYEIIRWMYIVVLFPLLFLALKKMLEEAKPVSFILLLAYILVLSLQFGIQICIFSFVYSACFICGQRDEEGKRVLDGHRCLITGISLISSLLLSAPATVPAVINIMNSARSSQNSSLLTVITHHGFDNILERIFEISNPVAIGLLVAVALILKRNLWDAVRKYKTFAWTLLILIITVVLEPSNLLWHLGSYQCFPVRYGYMAVWVGILLVCGLIDECHIEEKKGTVAGNVVLTVIELAVCVVLIAFVYIKRLMFAQAFATLDISGSCKKETVLLYAIVAAIVGVVLMTGRNTIKSSDRLSAVKLVIISATMGIIWFMAILWPQNSGARVQNEANYQEMNQGYRTQRIAAYNGHYRENDTQTLNAGLVNGAYSMSAYVPSGESLEYVAAMNKLGYEVPWISVTEKGGSELSDRLLGIEGDFNGAMVVSSDEYEKIKNIGDFSSLLQEKKPVQIEFDNRKGTVTVKAASVMDGYILLPMAYIEGWKTDQGNITSYLGGLLAVELTSATDTVSLSYSIPGFGQGMLLWIVGILMLAGCLIISGKNTWLDKLARPVYRIVLYGFAAVIYILPTAGLLVFVGAKAAGTDITPYLEISKPNDNAVHTLLDQRVEEDGIHVLVGCNNLMNDRGVKVTSSDDESGYFRASKAVDGDVTKESRWSSANDWDNNEHFLKADFKESKTIKAVKLYWERTNASRYYIEVSEDGENWSIVSEFDEPAKSNPQTIYYENGIQGRYIRLHVTDVTKQEEDLSLYYQNVSVNEMEVYDDECDSFVIATPKLMAGTGRAIPVPDVPAGYVLKIGGINYDNLRIDDDYFADTLADVDINLGYELYFGDQKWDLEGLDIVLPASIETAASAFPFKNVNVREWSAGEGTLSFEQKNSLVEALAERKDNSLLKIELVELPQLGDEGYEINIEDSRIKICAQTPKGMYWGRVTLSHMIAENSNEWKCGTIRDYPEYAVRGFVLDVARRPVSMELLYKMLDTMADNYMNTFQIHLSDNAIISISDYDGTVSGARELFSAYRLESSVSSSAGALTSEFHYSNEEFAEFIADAKAMGIDVVPEIDTPAHSLAITKLFPELGYDDYPELADTLDVSKPEVLEFSKKLWGEYLTGTNPLFEECDIIHLGADEFYGDYKYYSKYVSDLCTSLRDMAPDKTQRIWASMSYKNMDTSSLDRKVQMMVWNPTWADPLKTYEEGFGVINCLNKNLYIIVGSGNDRLDMDNLANNWKPNLFYDTDCNEKLPAWSSQMLGACYSIWNDHYSENSSVDDEGLYDRFEEPIKVLSDKLWNR